jgi:hypothetical protein
MMQTKMDNEALSMAISGAGVMKGKATGVLNNWILEWGG